MTESLDRKKMRPLVRRAMQLMNQYGLRELEYEDKENDEMLQLTRSSGESFPPLLEGRSSEVPGKLRSPSVGQLIWEASDGDAVERGDRLGEIQKMDEVLEITASCSGILTDPLEQGHVEYGQDLGSVLSSEEREEQLAEDGEDEQAESEEETE